MRYARKLAVAGAAMVISVGSANAGQEPRGDGSEEPAGAERQPPDWGVTGSEAPGPARARTDAGTGADGSGYVTRGQLDRRTDELVQRLERAQAAQAAQAPAPTFTDEG